MAMLKKTRIGSFASSLLTSRRMRTGGGTAGLLRIPPVPILRSPFHSDVTAGPQHRIGRVMRSLCRIYGWIIQCAIDYDVSEFRLVVALEGLDGVAKTGNSYRRVYLVA